jgi:predicted phage terminase large subunit-like protein
LTIQSPLSDAGDLLIPPALAAARAEMARRDFSYFVRLVRPQYSIQWFHDTIMRALQESGTADHDTRLGMALPAGHAKTEYSLLFVAWMAIRDPHITIKYVTYAAKKGEEQFERLKYILYDPLVITYFGAQIRPEHEKGKLGARVTVARVNLLRGTGWIEATGWGGNITGSRCDLVLIDDPFKGYDDSGSLTQRNKVWIKYGAEVKTRRREGRPFRILMLFTRWHVDDLAGRCKRHEGEDWQWIEIEAIKDHLEHPDDPRQRGEILWESQLPLAEALKEQTARPEIFAAMYQQRPIPASGRIFRQSWFGQWEVIPGALGTWYQSWDFRGGGAKDRGSFVVCLLAFKPHHEERLYIVDRIKERMSPDESLETFKARNATLANPPKGIAGCWFRRPMTRLVERKADGIMILALTQHTIPGVIATVPTVDKVTRARAVAPFVKAGQVVLPKRAAWLADFLEEVCNFPGADNDDQVDTLSQLLDYVWGATTVEDNAGAASATWTALMGKRTTA